MYLLLLCTYVMYIYTDNTYMYICTSPTYVCIMQQLISEGHYASAEIQTRLSGLAEEHTRLLETWKKRQDLFSQSHTFQLFLRDAEQRDSWISTQEAFLSNEDLGVIRLRKRLGGRGGVGRGGGGGRTIL